MTPLELKQSGLWQVVLMKANGYGLNANLVGAIVLAESNGDTNAVRFEPGTYVNGHGAMAQPQVGTKWPLIQSVDTEKVMRSMSFGLMQVMGFNARAKGFKGWLQELCEPAKGIEFGCQILNDCLNRWPKFEDAVSAYNHGSPWGVNGAFGNQVYVNEVMKYYNMLSKLEG